MAHNRRPPDDKLACSAAIADTNFFGDSHKKPTIPAKEEYPGKCTRTLLSLITVTALPRAQGF